MLFSLKLHIAVFCKLLHTNFPPLPLSDLPKVIPEKRLWTFPNRLNRPTCESLYVVSQQPSVSDRFISGGRKTNCLQKPISEWTHRGGNLLSVWRSFISPLTHIEDVNMSLISNPPSTKFLFTPEYTAESRINQSVYLDWFQVYFFCLFVVW